MKEPFTKPAPKPGFTHPAAVELAAKMREVAPSADFATSGEFYDRVELFLDAVDNHLRDSIEAVKNVYRGRKSVKKIVESELRRKTDVRGARITTKAIRHAVGPL